MPPGVAAVVVSDFSSRLAHGIDLSSSQIHRLVTQTPERLNVEVLTALCEILACSPADLIAINTDTRQQVLAGGKVVDLSDAVRPRRARMTRPSDDP
jgi:DNA-binding Xre family transcriptional regulator